MDLLKKIVSFEEAYLLVSKCSNKADATLWPWTQDLIDCFKQPSQYVYPCKTIAFTEKLREVFRGSFKDDNCEKLVDTTPSNPFETVLNDQLLRASIENTVSAQYLKSKGFTLEDAFKNIMSPIECTHYFISDKRKKRLKKSLMMSWKSFRFTVTAKRKD